MIIVNEAADTTSVKIELETVGPDCSRIFALDSEGRESKDHGCLWRHKADGYWVWSDGDDELGCFTTRAAAVGFALEAIESGR